MWAELTEFLKQQDTIPQIWWRDDDAVKDSDALQDFLHALSAAPLLLAVIADKYDASLIKAVQQQPQIKIAQHGFCHINHSKANDKKSEYPTHRSLNKALAEFQIGKTKLSKDFADQFIPVFVPPWNRLDKAFLPLLLKAGFNGISMYGNKNENENGNGNGNGNVVNRYDSHIDVINWKEQKKFIGTQNFILSLKHAITNNINPIGILTHHKIHNAETNRFLLDFTKFLTDNQNLIKIIHPPFHA